MTSKRIGVLGAVSLVLALVACGQPGAPSSVHEDLPWSAGSEADTFSSLSLSAGTNDLSDQTPIFASSGWGPYERDTSNGEQYAGDGHPMTLNGTFYPKGLGVHAESRLVYNLRGSPAGCLFSSDVGVDDEVGARGSVVFRVLLDGQVKYSSGKMTGSTPTKSVSLDLNGVKRLALVVGGAGDGIDYDHADWAGAKITCGSITPPPGTLDPTFTTTGFFQGQYDQGSNVTTVQPDGKLIGFGTRSQVPDPTPQTAPTTFFVQRLLVDGQPDPSFGTNGFQDVSVVEPVQAVQVLVQPDGKLLLLSRDHSAKNPAPGIFNGGFAAVTRLLPDGQVDPSFGTYRGGTTLLPELGDGQPLDNFPTTSAMALQPDGKIVVGGYFNDTFILRRLNTDGTLDSSFGAAGEQITPLAAASLSGNRLAALAVQPDGKIIASGGLFTTASGFGQWYSVAIRLLADGPLDTAFGTGGLSTFLASSRTSGSVAQSIVLLPGGQSVYASTVGTGSGDLCSLIQLDSAGRQDAGFAQATGSPYHFVVLYPTRVPINVVRQADGRLVLGGCELDGNTRTPIPALFRFNADGSQDLSFGTVLIPLDPINSVGVGVSDSRSVLIQPSGKIVSGLFTLTRINP